MREYPCEINFCGQSKGGNVPWILGLISSFLNASEEIYFMLCLGDFKVFYKFIKNMYKIVHLQIFLSYNKHTSAQSRRVYAASSKTTGQRAATSLLLFSPGHINPFYPLPLRSCGPLPQNKIVASPLVTSNSSYDYNDTQCGHEKVFHATGMIMAG